MVDSLFFGGGLEGLAEEGGCGRGTDMGFSGLENGVSSISSCFRFPLVVVAAGMNEVST